MRTISLAEPGLSRRVQRQRNVDVEDALHTQGYFAVPISDLGPAGTKALHACHLAAARFFAQPVEHRMEIVQSGRSDLGLQYLAVGEEPLYSSSAGSQRVHSLNAQALHMLPHMPHFLT